jgi:hypothetical protein
MPSPRDAHGDIAGSHVAGFFKQLTFCAVKIVTIAEGEITELHVGLKGTMNALFLKDVALKARRRPCVSGARPLAALSGIPIRWAQVLKTSRSSHLFRNATKNRCLHFRFEENFRYNRVQHQLTKRAYASRRPGLSVE